MKAPGDILEQVLRTIAAHKMLTKGDGVVVAVSGGPDSVALLHILHQLRSRLGIRLHIAHLDHGLRGRDSRADARYVRRMAGRMGLPISMERIQLTPPMEGGLEERARLARYDFLRRTARAAGARRIATGHTADDQAETVLMRLLRGAGSQGLSGIPPVRDQVVRPLIGLRRAQIEAYLRGRRLRPRQDTTNQDRSRLRNRIRQELLPLLEKRYNPGLVEVLNRVAGLEREESEYFTKLARERLKKVSRKASNGKIILDLSDFGDYFSIGEKYLIRELVRQARGDLRGIDHDHLERIFGLILRGATGSRVYLPGGVVVEREPASLFLARSLPKSYEHAVKLPGVHRFPQLGWTFRGQVLKRTAAFRADRGRSELEAHLDWDRLRGPFVLRSRRRGDRFRPLGMRGTRKLSDFFIDRKIPRWQRDEVPLLVGVDGIIWVVGLSIADPFKVTERTTSILWARYIQGSG
jgi:tRNA(Ile)-lysidine synthase